MSERRSLFEGVNAIAFGILPHEAEAMRRIRKEREAAEMAEAMEVIREDEERKKRLHAEREASLAEYRRKVELANAALPGAIFALDAIGDPVARKVLDLHQRGASSPHSSYWRCEGCDATGYDWEPADWPCRTTELIAEHYGIEIPPYFDRPEDGWLDKEKEPDVR
jgi:hypothetical protein